MDTKKKKETIKPKKNSETKKIVKEKFNKFNTNTFKTTEIIFLLIITAIVSLIFGYLLNGQKESKDKYLSKLEENYRYIIDNYYDEIDKDKLVNAALDGMLTSLDDYSELLEYDDNSTFYKTLEGTYEGVGIEIINSGDNIYILGVIENSPASKAGLKAGDIVKSVDDITYEGKNVSELTKYIQDNKKETYDFVIVRDNEELNIEVERSTVTIKSVLSKTIEQGDKKIGYIYVSIFANATSEQFKKALKELENENIDALIIDVRENTGGHLTTAVSILSNFLDRQKVIYQIEKDGKKTKHYSIGLKTKEYDIVVLQNKNSASASEVLSAALKESYGATIIGTTSYGKGTVQELVNISDKDNYKMTTKKWLTPKGNWINGKGVEPDIEVELEENEVISNDDDSQLRAAINYIIEGNND